MSMMRESRKKMVPTQGKRRRQTVSMMRESRKKMAVLSLSPPTATFVRILFVEASTPAKPIRKFFDIIFNPLLVPFYRDCPMR